MPIYEAECSECGNCFDWYVVLPTDENEACPACGGKADRLYSLSAIKLFNEFTTRNIDPSGRPIRIKSQKQLSSLCNQHNLVHLDDPKMDIQPQRFKSPGQILGMNEQSERELPGGASRKEDLL